MAKDLRQDAIVERRNLIIDGTLNDPEKALRLSRDLKAAGYEVDVRVLAVNERTSHRQVTQRLEEDLADTSGDTIPRDVPDDIQKEAYKGMPSAVAAVEASGFADRVRVYNRQDPDQPLYDSRDPQNPPGLTAEATILAERNREMTPVEKAQHAQGWDKVINATETRLTDEDVRRRPSPEELHRNHMKRELAHGELRLDPTASELFDRDRPEEPEPSPERFGREVEGCRRALGEARLASDYDPEAAVRCKPLQARMDVHAERAARDPSLLNGISNQSLRRDIEKRATEMPQSKTAQMDAPDERRQDYARKVADCYAALAESRRSRDYDPAAQAVFKARSKELEGHVAEAARDPRLLDGVADARTRRDLETRIGQEKAASVPEL